MGTRQLRWVMAFGILVGAFAIPADAQQDWVNFQNETTLRLQSGPNTGANDTEEKDYAWGDIDQDGDIDLICVRKEPFTTTGARNNVLFINEGIAEGHPVNGVLVAKTQQYASASTVPGDQGFLTATNDRDVVLVDLNNDGWLDMATAVTLADNQPTHIKMPRVYINLGDDPTTGDWLGFQYQDSWIPDLSASTPVPNSSPRFCAVAAVDINNDGLMDLYFGDYDAQGAGTPIPMLHDYNDRCLVNTGTAFVDSTATVFSNMLQPTAAAAQPFYQSTFSASVTTADMNGDGLPDLVKQSSLQDPRFVAISYANGTTGTFDAHDEVYNLAAYFVSAGDLNNDGTNDLVIVDDFEDRVMFNQGNNPNGTASFDVDGDGNDDWFNLQGSTSEFGGNSVIADLDNDGWNDVVVTDVDVDIPGCNRRMKLFRNMGNPPTNTLDDVSGPQPWTPLGTHDAAVFDLNGDGWLDMILGTCTGTEIWINDPPIGVDYNYPNGQASLVDPNVDVTTQVELTAVGGSIVAATQKVFYSVDGGAEQEMALTDLGNGLFEFTFLGAPCGTNVTYYLSAELDNGNTYTDPPAGAGDPYALSFAVVSPNSSTEDFETGNGGFTVSNGNGLTTGAWQRSIPVGTTIQGQPSAPSNDAGNGGDQWAFITQNGAPGGQPGAADVDGGPTRLISPAYDMSSGNAILRFDYWFVSVVSSFNYTAGDDALRVALSNDDGQTWSPTIVTFTHEPGAWRTHHITVGDHIAPTSQVRVRFLVADSGTASICEAGIDNVRVTFVGCPSSSFVRGDVDADGSINIVDAVTLLGHLFNSNPIGCQAAGDTNDDSALNIVDAVHMLSALFANGPAIADPGTCGTDPTPDSLTCDDFLACP